MRMIARGLATAAILVFASCANQVAGAPAAPASEMTASPVIQVSSGKLQGATREGISSFKGIPYATPPIGDNRWRAPKPAQPWQGIRQATEYGNDCPQQRAEWDDRKRSNGPIGEDCLTLNVWTPATHPAKGAPVMFWIHGGSFTAGSGAQQLYEGTRLAKRGVVIVTINYRLGRLGFFAHPALTAEAAGGPTGNWGFMDQILALKWVRENISAFGGDPNNITIAGESAGGGSVNVMMIGKESRGLFAKAISQSGGGQDRFKSLTEAEALGVAFAKRSGISDADPLPALRALSTDAAQARLDDKTYPGVFNDGKILAADVDTTFALGQQAPVPYMVGANDYELGFLPEFARKPSTAAIKKVLGDSVKAVETAYGSNELVERNLMGDAIFVEPARYLAGAAAAHRSYLYQFAYVPENLRGKALGAPHTGELFYVFGNMQEQGAPETPADRAMSDMIGDYWADFMKTGDPNGGGRTAWPQFSPDGTMMRFEQAGAVATSAASPALDALGAYQAPHRLTPH